jgi:radical SAM protein with 4Fe4S-binding SPASM domain
MIPYQVNQGGVIAILPDGRVEVLHPSALPVLMEINEGTVDPNQIIFEDYILSDFLVDLENFHLNAPLIAFIETTNLCNLRCKHCYADSGYKRPNEISTELIKQLLDEFAEMGVLQVFLTGGELFAHPNAIEIIQYARTKPFTTQIFTNGLLITEEKLAAIPPGQSFFISFDTADPERTIRGKMDFPLLRKKFDAMTRHGHIFRTAISVHRNNIQDAEEIFDWCAEHNFPRPQWLETHPIGRALLHPDIMLRPSDVDEVIEVYRRCMDRYSSGPEQEDDDQVETVGASDSRPAQSIKSLDTIKFCQRLEQATRREKCGRSVVYVNSAGDVYPCSNCMSNEMYRAGNIKERGFKEIWRDEFKDIRKIVFDDHHICESCEVNKANIWCQFRCPPLAKNVSLYGQGCGATDYLKEFMLRSAEYWTERSMKNIKLTLSPNKVMS